MNRTWQLSLPTLIFLVLMQIAAQAQSRWQGNVSIGASIPYNDLAAEGYLFTLHYYEFPFGLATTGASYTLGADYFWKEKTGFALSTGGAFLGYDREAAGYYFLSTEKASTASVTANSYYLHTIQLGFFHHFSLGEHVELRTAIYGGWSVLNTPEISVWLDTEPYSDIYFNRGAAASPLVMVELAPYFRINNYTQLFLSASWTVSNPEIEWQNMDGSQAGAQALNYGILGVRLGLAYRFAQASATAK